MSIRTLFFFVTLVFFISSCSSTRKGAKSDSPYLTEQDSATGITVREEKVKLVDQTDDPVYRYYVIIGSFKVIDNARQYKADLVKESFSPVILENENGLFRVSVGAFNDEKAARDKIARIRTGYKKYNDVWLLVRK